MELFIGETPLTMLDILYSQRMVNNVVWVLSRVGSGGALEKLTGQSLRGFRG